MRVGRVHSHCHPHCLQRYHYVTRLHLNSVQPALRACYLLRLARARGSLYSCRARKAPLGPAGPPGPPNDGRHVPTPLQLRCRLVFVKNMMTPSWEDPIRKPLLQVEGMVGTMMDKIMDQRMRSRPPWRKLTAERTG